MNGLEAIGHEGEEELHITVHASVNLRLWPCPLLQRAHRVCCMVRQRVLWAGNAGPTGRVLRRAAPVLIMCAAVRFLHAQPNQSEFVAFKSTGATEDVWYKVEPEIRTIVVDDVESL